MANFVATLSPVSDKNPGDWVQITGTVAAATEADAGTCHVVFFITGPGGLYAETGVLFSQKITTTPLRLSAGLSLPANARAGAYSAAVSVRTADWAWQTVTQTPSTFNSPVSAGVTVASLVKVSGDDQGGTVGQAQPVPMVVQALDSSNNPVKGATINFAATAGTLSVASATTDADGKASVTLTHPAQPQTALVTVSAGSVSVDFKQTSHMVLYGKRSPTLTMLQPAGPGDALAGVGFLPVTGDEWVRIDSASDEFDGSSIDLTKWRTRLPGGYDHYNDELQRYVDSGITVRDGTCKLTATALPYDPSNPGHAPSPSGFNYPFFHSGCISSHTLLSYGYFEARMKFPKGMGVWPAFWLLPNNNWQGEIDIVEFVFNEGTEHQNMIHHNNLCDWPGASVFWAETCENTQYGYWIAPGSLSSTYVVDDWHVVGCYWNEIDNTATIYIDGFPVVQRRVGPAGQKSAIILNMAMGGGWPTTNANGQKWTQPVSLDDQVFEIDYVRTFQKAGKISTAKV
jgi:hypothetical protein